MIKTVSLTADTETKVEISGGYNVGVINRTTGMLYASKNSGISAGADDVAAIPAGDSYVIRAADDTVYLLATAAGDVQLESIGVTEVFKIAAAHSSLGGGGTVDDAARVAIASHANNTDIHLTAEDVASLVSNENLLINPDFAINQRGQVAYSAAASAPYTLDGWRGYTSANATIGVCAITPTADGVVIDNQTNGTVVFYQRIEDYKKLFGTAVTMSAEVNGAVVSATGQISNNTGRSVYTAAAWGGIGCYIKADTYVEAELIVTAGNTVTATWAKLETGDLATSFAPSAPATELAKCQRYYQLHSTGNIDPLDLRPTMAAITDIKQRGDGSYEYIADI